jgi:hypothetical protein
MPPNLAICSARKPYMERNRFVHIPAFITRNIFQTKTIPDPQRNLLLPLRSRSQTRTHIRSRAITIEFYQSAVSYPNLPRPESPTRSVPKTQTIGSIANTKSP